MFTRHAHDEPQRGPARGAAGAGRGGGRGDGSFSGRGRGTGRDISRGPGPGGGRQGVRAHERWSHGFGPFGRARRGMIKAAVVAALAEGPMHGYQIMQRIQELSGGVWRPSPGSVYPTLQELEDRDLVRSEDVQGKRVYSLTGSGVAEADRLRGTEGDLPWMTADGPAGARMQLKQAVRSLAAAARQVGLSGSDETVAATLAILADARKRIYGLLAEAE